MLVGAGPKGWMGRRDVRRCMVPSKAPVEVELALMVRHIGGERPTLPRRFAANILRIGYTESRDRNMCSTDGGM